MSAFLQQAEDILDVAVVANDPGAHDVAILLDCQGGMRMLDAAGWSLPAMSAEFGATAVYKVERRGGTVRVEGWGGGQRCLIQRNVPACSNALYPSCIPPRQLGYL